MLDPRASAPVSAAAVDARKNETAINTDLSFERAVLRKDSGIKPPNRKSEIEKELQENVGRTLRHTGTMHILPMITRSLATAADKGNKGVKKKDIKVDPPHILVPKQSNFIF